VRAARPGGKVGLLSWTPEGMIGQLFKLMGPYAPTPPPGAQPPPGGQPPAPALPDLTIVSITGLQTSNDAPTVSVTVRNAGSAAAPASRLAVNITRSADDAHGETVLDVPALAAGQSTTVSTPCNPYASDMATAIADPSGAIAESDETNNALSATGQPCRYP
jgi:hypothetical protein